MISVRYSPTLREHLETFEVDGATVAAVLFEGGRLAYPGRKEIEHQFGHTEAYTLDLECRTIDGLPSRVNAAIRFLAREATNNLRGDITLDMLWDAHAAYDLRPVGEGPSLDRFVAALVAIEAWSTIAPGMTDGPLIEEASVILIRGLHLAGFPPTAAGLEELFDGAPPACVGLGLVDIDHVSAAM